MERILNRARRATLFALLFAGTVITGAEIKVPGLSQPFRDVTFSAPTYGTIETIRVMEGAAVKEGQVLIELLKKVEELEVDRRQMILADKSEVAVAAEQVKTLKAAYDSTRKLYEATGSVSKEDVAGKELEYKKAIAEEDRLKANEKRQEVDLKLAQEALREKSIHSTLTGHVVEVLLDRGEGCKAQDPLIRVVDTSKFFFEANVEASHGQQLKVGDAVNLEFASGNQVTRVAGKLSFVSPIVDPSSGLLRVKALCDNSQAGIKPGVDGYLILNVP